VSRTERRKELTQDEEAENSRLLTFVSSNRYISGGSLVSSVLVIRGLTKNAFPIRIEVSMDGEDDLSPEATRTANVRI